MRVDGPAALVADRAGSSPRQGRSTRRSSRRARPGVLPRIGGMGCRAVHVWRVLKVRLLRILSSVAPTASRDLPGSVPARRIGARRPADPAPRPPPCPVASARSSPCCASCRSARPGRRRLASSRASSTATSTTSRAATRRSPPATGCTQHDDRLEDFSAPAIAAEVSALKADAARLRAFRDAALTPDERVDRRILLGVIDGWLLEQETLQNWRRNPMLYASARHRRRAQPDDDGERPAAPCACAASIAKLQRVPALLAAARANVAEPAALFAERGAAMMRGASAMLGRRSRPRLRGCPRPRAARLAPPGRRRRDPAPRRVREPSGARRRSRARTATT